MRLAFVRKLTYSFRFIEGTLTNVLTYVLWSDFFNFLTFVFNMQASMKVTARRNLLNSCRFDIEVCGVIFFSL